MRYTNVSDTIDQLYESYLSFWEDICNIESPTADKAGVDAVGAYLIQWARERGWQIDVLEHPVAGNAICVTMNPHLKPTTLAGYAGAW